MSGGPRIFIWIHSLMYCILASFVAAQNKGEKFRALQAGDSFQLTLGSLTASGSLPSHFVVGGWFKWTRCTYASTKASATNSQLSEPALSSNWVPVHISMYHQTEARVFNCSSWQHIAVVYSISPTTGQMTPVYVLHKPMLRTPLNFDEKLTVSDNTNPVEVVLDQGSTTTARVAVHADLIQHRLFWYLDYKPPTGLLQAGGVVAAYAEIVSGLTSPLVWVLNTERYFSLASPVIVNGTTIPNGMLASFINDQDPAFRPGFSLRWNTTYEFPDLIQLPEVDGEYAIEPCITLILSFRVETSFNERNHKISTSINIQKGTFSLLRNFKLEQNFWSKGGKQNGTAFNLNPQNGRYQNLTSVISICYFPDFWSMRHELFRDGTRVVNLKGMHFRKDYFPYEAGLLNLRLSTTSNSARGNMMFLKSVRVLRGVASPRDIVLTKTALPSGCLVYRLIPARFNEEVLPHCFACDENHFLHQGACLPQVSGNPGQDSTCSFWEGLNYCAACISSHRADLHRYECTPSNFVCQAPQFTLDSVNQVCSNRDFNSACSIFQNRESGTSLCKCQVANCAQCSFSQCELCATSYNLVVDGTEVRCEASPLVAKGPAPKLGLLSTTLAHQVCSIKGCIDCASHSNICHDCDVQETCQVHQDTCHNSCLTCNGTSEFHCTSCTLPRLLDITNSCIPKDVCLSSTRGYETFSGLECRRCHSTCLTCVDEGENNCTSCIPGQFLTLSNECVTACASPGFFPDGTRCMPCHSTCKTCDGPKSDNCLTCPPDFHKEGSSCRISCRFSGGYVSNTIFQGLCPLPQPGTILSFGFDETQQKWYVNYRKASGFTFALNLTTSCNIDDDGWPGENCVVHQNGLVQSQIQETTKVKCQGAGYYQFHCNVTILNELPPESPQISAACHSHAGSDTGYCGPVAASNITHDAYQRYECANLACEGVCPPNCAICSIQNNSCSLCKAGYTLLASNGTCV